MGEEYGEERSFPFFCSFLDPRLNQSVRDGRRREFAELAFRWGKEIPDPVAPETFAGAKLAWHWPDGSLQAGLRQLYRDLLRARRAWPPLRDRQHTAARVIGENETVLELKRGSSPDLIAWANLTPSPQPVSWAFPPEHRLLLSTEQPRYRGGRSGGEEVKHLMPYELIAFGDASLVQRWG
jgi:maltooligosyltrehalose trehalohydrolase